MADKAELKRRLKELEAAKERVVEDFLNTAAARDVILPLDREIAEIEAELESK